jgi:hypothetical protein
VRSSWSHCLTGSSASAERTHSRAGTRSGDCPRRCLPARLARASGRGIASEGPCCATASREARKRGSGVKRNLR